MTADDLLPLEPAQARAVHPGDHIWLNASAGTGKTQVLAARVLRLLLDGVPPDAILCFTFTKAGAAEMAHRVHERLALWVGRSDPDLRADLQAIGADSRDPAIVERARTLFARVIDSPAGAIRVQTIHSFCQSLLASFPFEADVLPGFRLIEGSEAATLKRSVLGELLSEAGAEGARRRRQIGRISVRLGEQAAIAFVDQAAQYFQRRPIPRLVPTATDVRLALDLPTGDVAAWVRGQLDAGVIANDDLMALAAAWLEWGTTTGTKWAAVASAWLEGDDLRRAALLPDLCATVLTKAGLPNAHYLDGKRAGKLMPVADAASRVGEACQRLLSVPIWCKLADDLAAGWGVAADFASAWADRKRAEGYAEFDDLIARTASLLANGELSDWIRFKLDQRIDHLLIDEAQDTNADQWMIAEGLTDEFFAGEAARGADRMPSMFAVGDRKQAIFGFQGTDPVAFEDARRRFAAHAEASGRPFQPVDLSTNFRSAPAILSFVDRWLDDGGVAAMGIDPPVAGHLAFERGSKPGRVELWPPLILPPRESGGGGSSGEEEDAGDGVGNDGDASLHAATDPVSLKIAGALADRIAAWLDPAGDGIDGLPVRPDDILVLVRRRTSRAARIVAQLQARGIPVAGIDRFDLAKPLAVQDLLAAMRFVVQPDDEHSLAVLLVSPLIGWTQQMLYDETAARGRTPLRQWLAGRDSQPCVDANARLALLRADADFVTPFRLLDTILSGPLQGRRAMLARLGEEANDAIDALLNEALAYEARNIPSLIGFIDHVDRSAVQVKRQTDARSGLVRVMTVHGSKGLQAPIVILADATGDPMKNDLDATVDIAGWQGLPLFKKVARDAQPPFIETAWNQGRIDQLQEHWRLFYVAATRAERLLVITGTAKDADLEKTLPAHCWYRAAADVLPALDAEQVGVAWEAGPALRIANKGASWSKHALGKDRSKAMRHSAEVLPDWAARPAPEEARPPRPLAPSRLGDDDAPQRPAGGGNADAIRRGVLIHSLIERLPGIAAASRAESARRWLAVQAPGVAEPTRAAWADEACAVMAAPDWSALFGPGSLAEAPFSAVIDGGIVVAGTVDRLLVTDDAVLVVDYKTGVHIPATADAVPSSYLRQMAAYCAALAVIFPGRRVRAALLYTAAPRLIALPDVLLARHKPDFVVAKVNL